MDLGTGAAISRVGAAENSPKPAYLIVCSDRYPGLTIAACAQQPVVFEGIWPYQTLAIERFDSMDALKAFWYSDAYQAEKQLHEGLSTVNFIVGVESN